MTSSQASGCSYFQPQNKVSMWLEEMVKVRFSFSYLIEFTIGASIIFVNCYVLVPEREN